MAPQEWPITTRGDKKKKKKEKKKCPVKKRKTSEREGERKSSDTFWFRERQETFGELCVRTFVCLRTFYSQLGNVRHVYCPNVESEQSGKYTPFPRERHRSAAELILCGHSSGTWSFHSSLPPPTRAWRACACGWGDWGSRVWSMGDWFYVCVRAHVCVLESWLSTRPPTFCSVTPLCSLALCTLEKVFISPAPKHSRVFTVKGEKASVLHTCFSVCSYILQAGPVWEGCELLLKHKAVHSYLLYLVVAYKKNISELVWIHFAANKWSPLFLGRGTND